MSHDRPFTVVGAGDHALVVIAALHACGEEVRTVLDDDEAKWGGEVLGVPVSGPVETDGAGADRILLGVGDNRLRERFDRELEVSWGTVVHPAAWVHESVLLGPGAMIMAGAVVQPGSVIGHHTIVNTGATVDHHGRIGAFVHLAPGAHLGGRVTVNEGALVGVGSSVIPGRTVGAWSTVGAGSAVVRDVPAGTTVGGCPARSLGSAEESENRRKGEV